MISFTIKKTYDTRLDIRGSNSNIFEIQSHHQKDFEHRNFRGCSGAFGVFYFERQSYNYSDSGKRAWISPKFETRTIILGRKEYQSTRYI